MRTGGAGGAHAFLPGDGECCRFMDCDVESPRAVRAGDGASGPGIRREHSFVFTKETSAPTHADSRGRSRYKLAARSVAFPMEDRRELALRLLHFSAVHASSVRISRAG